tara:strand:+ start:74 stop:481 length:408 start_codon:yes stop_codon:yes gene_type:complete
MSQQKYDDKVLDESRLKNVEQRSEKVDQLLRQNQYVDALQTALENPPVGSKNEEIKKKNANVVFRALAAIPERDNDIKGIIDGLTIDAQDTLMKYIYRALGEAQSCGSMLKWHGALLEKAGIGAIVRTMVDRKTV